MIKDDQPIPPTSPNMHRNQIVLSNRIYELIGARDGAITATSKSAYPPRMAIPRTVAACALRKLHLGPIFRIIRHLYILF